MRVGLSGKIGKGDKGRVIRGCEDEVFGMRVKWGLGEGCGESG